MSNTPEGKVKVKARKWLHENMPGHWFLSPRGGPFGKIGCPDWIICWMGVFVAIEVKSDEGQATTAQIEQLKLIGAAGGVAAVLKGYDVMKLQAIKAAVLLKVNRRTST